MLLSGIVHEIVLGLTLGYFFPILFIFFQGPGIMLINNKLREKKLGHPINIMFWLSMYFGVALLFTIYLAEHYARMQISTATLKHDWGILEPIIPRLVYVI